MRALGIVLGVVLAAAGARAAGDCLEPLRANAGWRCQADLSNGDRVDYCFEHTHRVGADPASRFFKAISTGPYLANCSCEAKGELPGAAFGDDKTYLCLDRATDTVIHGKVTKRKMSGETFNVSANLRSAFSCRPDPACDLPPVVDPDLPPETGFADLLYATVVSKIPVTGGGYVDIGGLAPGCGGYTSEAPEFVFHLDPPTPTGSLEVTLFVQQQPQPALLLVVTPSGAAHCTTYTQHVPLERGPYAVWVAVPTPGTSVGAELQGAYRNE